MIARLAAAWGLDKTATTSVRAMFSSKTTFRPVHDPELQEVCFSFWGFVPSDEARWKLLEFFFLQHVAEDVHDWANTRGEHGDDYGRTR